jgi:hypothetical protein
MAFRPDLVDMTKMPEGALSASKMGILHGEPIIPAEFNPRHTKKEIAEEWGRSVVENIKTQIKIILH